MDEKYSGSSVAVFHLPHIDDPKCTHLRHWEIEGFAALELQEEFDMTPLRRKMRRTFKPRGETGFFHFDRPEYDTQYVLPQRFAGLI